MYNTRKVHIRCDIVDAVQYQQNYVEDVINESVEDTAVEKKEEVIVERESDFIVAASEQNSSLIQSSTQQQTNTECVESVEEFDKLSTISADDVHNEDIIHVYDCSSTEQQQNTWSVASTSSQKQFLHGTTESVNSEFDKEHRDIDAISEEQAVISTQQYSLDLQATSSLQQQTNDQLVHQVDNESKGKRKYNESTNELECSLQRIEKHVKKLGNVSVHRQSADTHPVADKSSCASCKLQDAQVLSEEITTQEMTLVFLWPKNCKIPPAPPPSDGEKYRELFSRRVTRITDYSQTDNTRHKKKRKTICPKGNL